MNYLIDNRDGEIPELEPVICYFQNIVPVVAKYFGFERIVEEANGKNSPALKMPIVIKINHDAYLQGISQMQVSISQKFIEWE